MKCVFEDNHILVYLPKCDINEKSFEDLSYIEEYFREIFLKIKQKYNIELSGFYFVNVYIDLINGIILEIEEEQLEFIEYYDDAIDMKIVIHQEEFLYETSDVLNLPNDFKKNFNIYYYQNRWYLKLKNKMDDNVWYQILEYTKIIYKGTNWIIKYGKKM